MHSSQLLFIRARLPQAIEDDVRAALTTDQTDVVGIGSDYGVHAFFIFGVASSNDGDRHPASIADCRAHSIGPIHRGYEVDWFLRKTFAPYKLSAIVDQGTAVTE